jgi:hypothetical protein
MVLVFEAKVLKHALLGVICYIEFESFEQDLEEVCAKDEGFV